jgi:ketosteroid isomerase-like protein
MTEPIDIVRRCYQAYTDHDRAAIEALLTADFTFTSPLDNCIDRATYFERCWPNHERITGFDFARLIHQAENVVVTYEGHGEGGRGFRNTEIFTLRDEKIIAVEVYFGWPLPHKAEPGGFVEV